MVYIEAMQVSLDKKLVVLQALQEYTDKQAELLRNEEFDDEKFKDLVEKKDEKLTELTKLDDGFEKMYEKIKEEMMSEPEKHKDAIIKLQGLIRKVTEAGVSLEASERRNKEKLDLYIKTSRGKIKTFNKSNAAVSQYYKNANNAVIGESFFMDKKN